MSAEWIRIRKAMKEQDTEWAYLLSVYLLRNGEEDGLYPIWFPKSCVKREPGAWYIKKSILQQKEQELSKEQVANIKLCLWEEVV